MVRLGSRARYFIMLMKVFAMTEVQECMCVEVLAYIWVQECVPNTHTHLHLMLRNTASVSFLFNNLRILDLFIC